MVLLELVAYRTYDTYPNQGGKPFLSLAKCRLSYLATDFQRFHRQA